jgi:hypothetical protein
MHEHVWVGFEGFDAFSAAEFHDLAFIDLGVSFFGIAERPVNDEAGVKWVRFSGSEFFCAGLRML